MNFKQRLATYSKTYDIDGIESPNDKANLDIIINNQELIDLLQKALDEELKNGNIMASMQNIRQIQESRRQLIDQNMQIEKLLGIDRKSRKKDTQESVADYIQFIKTSAREFLEKQYINVYCEKCKILVGRIIPVHEYTEFIIKFQCSQCNKFVEVKRKERDVFFDLKERNKEWRKKYPVEIVQGKLESVEADDDVFLEDEEND